MRLAFVAVAAVVALFASSGAALTAVEANQPTNAVENTADVPLVARVLHVEANYNRFLRVESTTEADGDVDEERAISGLSKLTEKLKPASDKLTTMAKKLTPAVEKLTDKSLAIAVRLKPIADTFTGKLKPIADKLGPILKPIAAKLNTAPSVKKLVAKFKAFVEKVKNTKVGQATLSERYTMAKFENWFRQNKSPDEIKAMLKVGTGTTVNTKNYDLWNQYSVFYNVAQREKEAKVKVA
jgi:hypothetical protein